MKTKCIGYFLFSVFLLLLSCKKPIQHNDEFTSYIQKFITAAVERNHKVDLKDIDLRINFGELDRHYEGKCKPGSIKQITINEILWNKLDTLQKELLIFHELGHCLLGRTHKNEIFPTGECKSIMDGKEDGFECSNNYYSSSWRTYYLNELFNPLQKIPSWYKAQIPYFGIEKASNIIYDKSLKEVFEENGVGIIAFPPIDFSKNFQIDLLTLLDTTSKGGLLISFKNLTFAHNSNSKRINIRKTNGKGSRNNFYYTNSWQLSSNQLTIRKQDSFLHFFVNKKLLHTTENFLSNDPKLENSYLKNRLQIRARDKSAKARFSVFEF